MEITPSTTLQLPPLQTVKDVRCVCFHYTLPSVYLTFHDTIVEFDLVTGAEVSKLSLRVPATHTLFLPSHNAIVACIEDGSVEVVSVVDGHLLAEHQPSKPSERRPVACATLHIPVAGSFPFLIFARVRSNAVFALNLLSQNKKLPMFVGHKANVNCVACHRSLPLMACAAVDGTVRVFQTSNMQMYNVVLGERDKDNALRPYVHIEFHADGSSTRIPVPGGKKKAKKNMPPLFTNVKLLLVSVKGMVSFYDVSTPGMPKKLREFFSSGTIFRAAHFHTLKSNVIFLLDHRGRFLATTAEPHPDEAQKPAPPTPAKGAASLKAQAHAFNILHEYENIAPLQLNVDPHCRSRADQTLSAAMHPSAPFFVFLGAELTAANSHILTVHTLNCTHSNGRGAQRPLITPSAVPESSYWTSSAPREPVLLNGTVASAYTKGHCDINIVWHHLDCSPSSTMRTIALPSNSTGPMTSCFPISLHHYRDCSTILLTVLHTGRQGKGVKSWAALSTANDKETVLFAPGHAQCMIDGKYLIVDGRKQLLVAKGGTVEDSAGSERFTVTAVFACDQRGSLLVIHFTEATGYSGIFAVAGWEALKSFTPSKTTAVNLDPDEVVNEVAGTHSYKPGEHLLGVATSRRCIIMSSRNEVLTSILTHAPSHSLHWTGWSLMYASAGDIYCGNVKGTTVRLSSIPVMTCVCSVLPDRLVMATYKNDGEATLWWRKINLFEPILFGVLGIPDEQVMHKTLEAVLPLWDCTAVTQELLGMLWGRIPRLAYQIVQEAKPLTQGCSLLMERLGAGSEGQLAGQWYCKMALQMYCGKFDAALRTIRKRIREAMMVGDTLNDTQLALEDNVGGEVGAAFINPLATLFQHTAWQGAMAVAEEVVKLVHTPFLLLSALLRLGDGKSLGVLSNILSTRHPAASKAAAVLSKKYPAKAPVESSDGGDGKWTIGTEFVGKALLDINGSQQPLEPLRSVDMTVYGYSVKGGTSRGNLDLSTHATSPLPDSFGGRNDAAEDSDDDDNLQPADSSGGWGSIDDRPGEPSPMGIPGDDDNKSAIDDEEDIARQQEELRRQYLMSYSGGGGDDDDDEGMGIPKRTRIKFRINTEAIHRPPPSMATVSLGLSLAPAAPAPTAGRRRRRGTAQEEGDESKPSEATSATPATPPPDTAAPTPVGQSAGELLRTGFTRLEKERYGDALNQMKGALVYFINDATQVTKKTSIIQVVQYMVVLNLLSEIKDIEEAYCSDDLPKLSFMLTLATTIPLQKKHSVAVLRKAVKWNMEAENYGVAAMLLDKLVDKLGDEAPNELLSQVDECTEKGKTNATLSDERLMHEKVLFCWETHTVIGIEGGQHDGMKCSYCPATFAASAVTSEKCSFCQLGAVEAGGW
eukprot:Sspe_Gene.34739::Locus_16863_Transcript_2_3_Confidence_0.222_Length_4321::g.34739::m.34739